MLSSGMFAPRRPSRMPAAGGPARRCGPARRGGPVRPCASSVFSATSAISVFTSALSPKNPSFVFIQLRTLSFSVYNIFPFKRFAFNPFRTLSRNGGVGINSSQSGTRHSALIPLQLIQVLSFHTLAHSLAQWAQHNPFGINSFRTLSIAMGVEGYFFRIRKAMRTPRSEAPRGFSNFDSGISSRVHSDFRFRLPPSAPCACLPNVLHSPPPSSSPAAAPPSPHHCPAGHSPPHCPSPPSATASPSDYHSLQWSSGSRPCGTGTRPCRGTSRSECPAAGPGYLPWRPVLPRFLSS